MPTTTSHDLLASDRMLATSAAVLAGATLFSTGAFSSWTGIGVVGLLMAVVEEDVRHRRIPNRLTGFGLAAALVHAVWTAGPGGLLTALAGAAVGLAVLGLPFVLRVLGAGDVKAVMALGAFSGPALLVDQLWWITVLGGLFAAATLLSQGGVRELAARWGGSLALSLANRRPAYLAPSAGEAAAVGLPFGVALALGVAAHSLWSSTWHS